MVDWKPIAGVGVAAAALYFYMKGKGTTETPSVLGGDIGSGGIGQGAPFDLSSFFTDTGAGTGQDALSGLTQLLSTQQPTGLSDTKKAAAATLPSGVQAPALISDASPQAQNVSDYVNNWIGATATRATGNYVAPVSGLNETQRIAVQNAIDRQAISEGVGRMSTMYGTLIASSPSAPASMPTKKAAASSSAPSVADIFLGRASAPSLFGTKK